MGSETLRVCIDARVDYGKGGGVEQLIVGLASGLSEIGEPDEEYLFLVNDADSDWLAPYLGGNCRTLLAAPRPLTEATGPQRISNRDRMVRAARVAAPFLKPLWHKFNDWRTEQNISVPVSDGTIEANGVAVMHFTLQSAFRTSVPSIYHPHDFQHRHYPQFFERRELRRREVIYGTFARQAAMVATVSRWVKDDAIRQLALPAEKVRVVPYAPPNASYPTPTDGQIAAVKEQFELPDRFVFYPAQTWPHKNHLQLLEALAWCRTNANLVIPLIASGRTNAFYPTIEQRIADLALGDQVRFLGFVSPLELQCLYRSACAVVLPTLFEAASFPLWEAFLAGVPTACSRVTSLPEQAGDAALLFDPNDPRDIGRAILRLWDDAELRRTLVERGRQRVESLDWPATARAFRTHYRRIAGRPLSDDDRRLLANG